MESVRSQGSDRYSLSSMRSEFDVFLSFRGPDARYGIVDHLYECMTGAGLRVFKDDEEIRRGEVIGGELKRAIDGSRVYVVVFSRNYASSVWCLRELDMMVDLCGGSNVGAKIILPIFYGADPADLKLRTELYRKALNAHKDLYRQDVVMRWKEALKTVGGISGWDCKAIQGEGRFVRLIVQDIVVKLRIKDQSLPDHLTGIDDQVSNMLNLLDCDSSGVRLVVLHGMGGIGKTTLARFIFNELHSRFEGSSFISDVRETYKGHGGIEKLQNKLSEDILGGQYARSCNFDDGYSVMIQRIQGKRILLVLDDVDRLSQLEKLVGKDPKDTLGTGTRIIITTRDKSVCDRFIRPGSELLHFYEMEKMANNYAIQLFSRHAFGTDEPPENYLCLSKQVVKATSNLPLTLEVIGGYLCCQSKESWTYELEKLKNVPPQEVFEILKVSYDGLDWREKEIFLDIACFQEDEMPRMYADYLWEARDLYPKSGVKVLINNSLIKIDSFGKFWIHDQLRDMGREIIRSEGDGRPERRTRLWDPEDALKIVLQKQISKKIIAMTLGRRDEAHKFSDGNFSGLSNLLLGRHDEAHKFSYMNFSGLSNLLLGRHDEAHKFSYENFSGLSNLLFLDLNGTKFIGDFGNIRESILWLSWWGCNEKLNSNFFKMRSLVVLRINRIKSGWRDGEKLMMPNLRVLEFRSSDMTTSPDLSCCLKLETMSFLDCFKLKEIHHSVGKLESLTSMKISSCPSLRSLPKELGCARALRQLIVTSCEIEEVPESIGKLESLWTLDLQYNKIRRLPTSICDLKNLISLCTGSCPLEEGIPKEIGNLLALVVLNLSYTNIRILPSTFSQLTSLKSLNLRGCRMLQELQRLPISLTSLEASSCPLDKGIPKEIGRLSDLKELDLSYSEIRFLPSTISKLTSLKSLKLRGCNMLKEVRELPTSLTYFEFSWMTVGLSEEICCTKGYGTRSIKSRGVSELGFLSRLKTRGLSFPDMASLQTFVEISDFTLTEMKLGGLDSLPNRTKLSIRSSDSLLRVSNIGRLRGLRSLKFEWCRALVDIPGLEQLEMLEVLEFSLCHSICGIQDLLGLKRLKIVNIYDCPSLLHVPRLIDECLLRILFCDKLRSFEDRYSKYERATNLLEDDSGE